MTGGDGGCKGGSLGHSVPPSPINCNPNLNGGVAETVLMAASEHSCRLRPRKVTRSPLLASLSSPLSQGSLRAFKLELEIPFIFVYSQNIDARHSSWPIPSSNSAAASLHLFRIRPRSNVQFVPDFARSHRRPRPSGAGGEHQQWTPQNLHAGRASRGRGV